MLRKDYVELKHSPIITYVMSNWDINEGFSHNTNFIKEFVVVINILEGYVG